jgi:putative pyoverdin transport system ATP-binding/permease protein
MKVIAFFFKYSRNTVLLSACAGIISGACNVALLAVINSVLRGHGPTSALVWSFVGLCALLPVTRFSSECLLTSLGEGAMYNLRMQLCRQIVAAPLRHLEQLGTPRLLAALTDDVPAIAHASLIIPVLCVNASLVIGCLVYMGIMSPVLLAIVLGFMVVGIASYRIPILKVQKIFDLARADVDVLQGHFHALTQGTKELKIHSLRRQAFFSEELTVTAGSVRRYTIAGQNMYSAAANWGQTMVFVVIGLILFALPALRPVTTIMMVAYALTLLYLMMPLQVILNALPQLSRANVALRKAEELGFTLSSQGSEEIAAPDFVAGKWRKLEFRSVAHTYRREDESDTFAVGPIDLSFEPGELVFIIGGNGSGKTTLVKLLTGLYTPESGQIMLDDNPVDDGNKECYRQHFSAVFSDCYLFEQMFGLINPELDTQARKYLVQLKLSQKVDIVNGRLSTTELSQGQRKRLALLTAYVEDRPIYVFDEWAADQDPQFKGVFYTQLLPELKAKGKTVFVISHDDRYYSIADRIIKLDDGQIVSDTLNPKERFELEVAPW